jgi:6-phosphogluconolactonase
MDRRQSSPINVSRFADPAALSDGVAAWLLQLALATDGRFAICLSGGSTPKRLYERLAEDPLREAFPWFRTHLFWGDERFVAHDDAESNYRMVREALLSKIPIPPAQIHPVPFAGLRPADAAHAYSRTLKTFYGADHLYAERPLFDVTFLGLGPDGHTASLFPGTEVLAERQRWAAEVIGAKPEPRITLTYPVLESSRHVAFLVEGAAKQAMCKRLIAGDSELPAAAVKPVGQLHIFADVAAAGEFQGE